MCVELLDPRQGAPCVHDGTKGNGDGFGYLDSDVRDHPPEQSLRLQ
jgi:hypothetical protein